MRAILAKALLTSAAAAPGVGATDVCPLQDSAVLLLRCQVLVTAQDGLSGLSRLCSSDATCLSSPRACCLGLPSRLKGVWVC